MPFKFFLISVALIFSLLPRVVLADTIDQSILIESTSSNTLMKVSLSSDSASIKVDHVANVLDRLKEKITLLFKFSNEEKVNYMQELTNKRLGELVYIMTTGEGDLIEELSSRYATYISRLSTFVEEKKIDNDKINLLKTYETHLNILNNIQQNFEFESGWWILLQHDINTVKMSQEKLNK